MRLTAIGFCFCLVGELIFAQPFVHPLAKMIGENQLQYFLNADGDVLHESMPYELERIASRKSSRKPFEVKEFFANGKIAMHTFMHEPDPVSNRFEEHYISYYPTTGDTNVYYRIKKGRKHGEFYEFYSNGQLKEKSTYKFGKLDGLQSRYYANGNFMEVGMFSEGMREGVFKSFDEQGKATSESAYFRGKKKGPEKNFHTNGKTSSMIVYDNGLKSGGSVSYYPNENIQSKEIFEQGLKIGEWHFFNEAGELIWKQSFEKDKPIGDYFEWNENMDTLAFGIYSNGRFSGFTRSYSKKGQRVIEKQYKSGNAVGIHHFDPSGAFIHKGELSDKGWLMKCNDSTHVTSVCNFDERKTPSAAVNMEQKIMREVSFEPVDSFTSNSVFSFSVDGDGKLVHAEVIDHGNADFDALFLDYLRNQSWKGGHYYGEPSIYSNHLVLNIDSNGASAHFGRFYFDDSLLLEHEHVPALISIIEQENTEPKFPTGNSGMFEYLASSTNYPDMAKESGAKGMSFVGFSIQPSGVVSNAEVISSVYPPLDYEALRVVNEMPVWIPGRIEGKEVEVYYKLPFRFTL
ncbi:MAG: TonB family protein, partial [Salibacteraceae bacterium]